MARVWPILALCLCVGCASSTTQVDTQNDTETTVSFDWRDLDGAASQLSQSLLASPRIGATAEKPALVVFDRLDNDTCQHLDTDLITQKIAEALLLSERFQVSATFGATRDDTIADVRAVRGNDEFDASTLQAKGNLRAPDLSLTGKLTQRNVRRDNGGLRIEYFLTLKATRLSDGVTIWQDSCQVVKAVAEGMPVW